MEQKYEILQSLRREAVAARQLAEEERQRKIDGIIRKGLWIVFKISVKQMLHFIGLSYIAIASALSDFHDFLTVRQPCKLSVSYIGLTCVDARPL